MRTNAVLFIVAAFVLVGFIFATADMMGKAYGQGIPPGCTKGYAYTKGIKVSPPGGGEGPCKEKPGKGL